MAYFLQDDGSSRLTLDDNSGFLLLDGADVVVPFISAASVAYPPIVSSPIHPPFIAATTVVYDVDVATGAPGRLSQLPVEVLAQADDARLRTSQLPVEVLVSPSGPARLSQLPAEVLRRATYETVTISIID